MPPLRTQLQLDAIELSDISGDLEASLLSQRGYDPALVEAATVAVGGALLLLRQVHEDLELAEFDAFRKARAIGLCEARARWEARGRKNTFGVADVFHDATDAEHEATADVAVASSPVTSEEVAAA